MVTSSSNIEVNDVTPNLAELIAQAKASSTVITLIDKGEKKAVLLSIDAFEHLVGLWKRQRKDLMPDDEFEQQFHRSLVESGYDTREKIIDLVRDVKREMYEERHQ